MSYFDDMFDMGIEVGIVFDGENAEEIEGEIEAEADRQAKERLKNG